MILNVAFYQFADFGPDERRRELRVRLQELGLALDLRGTILLASEGINGFLAGNEEDVRAMLAELRALPEFVGLTTKDSWSEDKPFGRFKVKLKREIISMGRPHIRPHEKTGSRLLPVELKKWLDEGREFLLLDTRNTYEIEKGTFEKARHLNIQNFRQFGEALETIEPETRKKPVVMFCTGGIRCEKATALALQDAGFTDVHQVEGGILRYFEDCGNAHYNGGCFVFDERDTLASDLRAQSTAV